jgi:hypothetical protein
MTRLTTRSSTIFVGTSTTTQVYRSLSELPPQLRHKLQESTQSINSATILIADKRGREELIKALQGRPTDIQCRLADTVRSHRRKMKASGTRSRGLVFSLRTWMELLLPVVAGASLWLLIGSRL